MWFSGKDDADDYYSIGYATASPSPIKVYIDILPRIDPNIIPRNRHGLIDVALIGTPDFNVRNADIETIKLENVSPSWTKFRDIVAVTPGSGSTRSHPNRRGDGYMDLVLKFKIDRILNSINHNEDSREFTLSLTGKLSCGRDIIGQDNIVFRVPHRRHFKNTPHGQSFSKPVSDINIVCPDQYTISQNYPNPFNPVTTIEYALPEMSEVKIMIIDINGRIVEELINSQQQAGFYSVEWNASRYSSGVYFYQIRAGVFQQVKKMLLIK